MKHTHLGIGKRDEQLINKKLTLSFGADATTLRGVGEDFARSLNMPFRKYR